MICFGYFCPRTNATIMKVISLIRVSTAAQSLDSQSEQVRNFILKDGYRESDIIPIESIESGSDNMMNANKNEINALEDIRQDLTYNLSVINNKLILAANPLLLEENPAQIETKEDLKEAIHKYIKKIVAVKIGFSRYEMSFQFLDGQIIKGRYFSTNKKLELELL